MSLFNRGVAIIAVLGVLGVGVLGYVNKQMGGALVEARAQVQDARQDTKAANAAAGRALIRAAVAESLATRHADKAEWKPAYEEQKRATAILRVALVDCKAASEKLDKSSGHLVNASHPSFWGRLVPKAGVGGAVGIDPTGKPNAVVGLTLSWTL